MKSILVYRKLKSIRSEFNYRSSKHRNMAIAREAEQMFTAMSASGLAAAIRPEMRAAEDANAKLHIEIRVYRWHRFHDKDNLESSVNKLLIDPLVRAGYFPSDADKHIDVEVKQFPSERGYDFVSLAFSVGSTKDA